MDPVVQGAIITVAGTLALAVIGGFIRIVWSSISDRKFFNEIKDKIGNTEGFPLSKQHEAIKETIIEKTNGVEKIMAEKTNGIAERQSNILNKVESIDKLLSQKETEDRFRLESMNESQKEIKSHMQGINKLAEDWERTIAENKELKARNAELEKKYMELDKQYDELEIKNQELEKQNKELLSKNRKARDIDKGIDM